MVAIPLNLPQTPLQSDLQHRADRNAEPLVSHQPGRRSVRVPDGGLQLDERPAQAVQLRRSGCDSVIGGPHGFGRRDAPTNR